MHSVGVEGTLDATDIKSEDIYSASGDFDQSITEYVWVWQLKLFFSANTQLLTCRVTRGWYLPGYGQAEILQMLLDLFGVEDGIQCKCMGLL